MASRGDVGSILLCPSHFLKICSSDLEAWSDLGLIVLTSLPNGGVIYFQEELLLQCSQLLIMIA